jgi:hypothetical protein
MVAHAKAGFPQPEKKEAKEEPAPKKEGSCGQVKVHAEEKGQPNKRPSSTGATVPWQCLKA